MLVVVLLYPRSLKKIRMDYTTHNLVSIRGRDVRRGCIPGGPATRQTTVW